MNKERGINIAPSKSLLFCVSRATNSEVVAPAIFALYFALILKLDGKILNLIQLPMDLFVDSF